MNHRKQMYIAAFALFSLFFGAGNLILPPFLGYQAGNGWFWVWIGFLLSAVIIPILAIYGHAKLQGSLLDFGKKVSPQFAVGFALIIYAISISLPSPRTASVTHEMAIMPYFSIPSWVTSAAYFGLVLLFALYRSKMLNFIGKYLTPLIFIILLTVIIIGLFTETPPLQNSALANNFSAGLLEGYQTFDAIGGVVVGGVIVISLSFQKSLSFLEKKKIIGRAGLLAGSWLFLVYAGLIALGAHFGNMTPAQNRTEYLAFLSTETLGSFGSTFLAVLVSLACFTTAVGIVTGTADFVKGLLNNSHKAYIITAFVGCVLGVVMGQLPVNSIINIAYPVLLLVYPLTIVLILLTLLPEERASKSVFRGVVLMTFIFSVPDFLGVVFPETKLNVLTQYIPLAHQNMGWVLPAILTFVLLNFFQKKSII
ncbi:MAG: branched-chain amino acid transport system II carrier protein [Flavobacteriaceae bacterium]